eukprot:3915693-Alexandrium_andersonii.AAC.1
MAAKWLDGACMAVAFDAKGDVNETFLENSYCNVEGITPGTPSSGARAETEYRGKSHAAFFEEI